MSPGLAQRMRSGRPEKAAGGRYEAVIGLEVHAQLTTRTKMFCRCAYRYGAAPNTLVCPVCLGYPGALPTLNRHAVDLALSLALAVGATIHPRSVFARKNYVYPDLPKGYQITQYEHPLATGGRVPLPGPAPDQAGSGIRLRRLHLEEDAGKLVHERGATLVDFNRCGVPLVEIVTEPDLRSPAGAAELLRTLHRLLRHLGVSEGSMEQGSLRCDANVSVRPRRGGSGSGPLGAKVELKNLNSFRHLERALGFEIERQGAELAAGGAVAVETRSFDAADGVTRPLRGKGDEADYRYFPEPDLPVLEVSAARRERIAAELPELPWDRRARFEQELGLPAEDARVLADSPGLADFFEAAVAARPGDPKLLADWIRTELLRELRERSLPETALAADLPPERFAELVGLVAEGRASAAAARKVLGAVWGTGEGAGAALERLGLVQERDAQLLTAWIDEVVEAHPEEVARWRAGERKLIGFFVGRVMALSAGRADPRRVRELLERRAREGGTGGE